MTSCNQWNIPKYVLIVCYVKKELCTLFYRLFHLSMLLWKQRASRVNMYLMGDRINCPFRVFIRDLEKTQQQGLLGLFYIQCSVCDFKHISELYNSHFIKCRYSSSVLWSCVTSCVSSIEKNRTTWRGATEDTSVSFTNGHYSELDHYDTNGILWCLWKKVL